MTLYRFLRLDPISQERYLSDIKLSGASAKQEQWRTIEVTPRSSGYYSVIVQYGRRKNTRRLSVARWNGDHWGDCYDDYKTTGGRYSAWSVLEWADL